MSRELITELRPSQPRAVRANIVDRIAVRSDGVPLFVEELAKGAVEARRTPTRIRSTTFPKLYKTR